MTRRYRKPPIVEAICEFRFEPGDWDSAMLGLVWEHVKQKFPKRQDVQKLGVEIVPTPSGAEHKVTQRPMVRYVAEDGRVFMQVGPHFMSVNHLAPYTGWEDFRPLIETAFNAYQREAKAKMVTRIGLRYINRVELPESPVELEEYLELRPFVGSALPHDHASFIVGVDFPFNEGRDVLRLQVATTQPEREGDVALILDLDHFTLKPTGVPVDQVSSSWLESAHTRVEDAFEAAITNKLRLMFDEIG